MKRLGLFLILLAVAAVGGAKAEEYARPDNAADLLAACREGMPLSQVTLSGRLIVRKPRGFIQKENRFTLHMDWGVEPAVATCALYEAKGTNLLERVEMTRPRMGAAVIKRFAGNPQQEQEPPSLASRVAGTDLLWLDLTLDFLWWPNAAYDDDPRVDRRVLGRACEVVFAKPPKPIPGCSGVRMWIDKQTGFLMKAEKAGPAGEALRYFWVQKVKEFPMNNGGEPRWMIRLIKAEARDGMLQTQLLVDALNDEEFEDRVESE